MGPALIAGFHARRDSGKRGPINVFAVEDTSVQLSWSSLPFTDCTFVVGSAERHVVAGPQASLYRERRLPRLLSDLPGGPGAVVIDGLSPSMTYDVRLVAPGMLDLPLGTVRTLPKPPGELLARFATFSDMHIGEARFGASHQIVEGPELESPSAILCLEAAVAEAVAWGAELLVSRGDMTRSSHPEEFATVARLLLGGGVGAVGVLGNHDVRHRVDGPGLLAAAGLPICTDIAVHDLPGIRLVLAHSPLPTAHRGHLGNERIAAVAKACREAPASQRDQPGPAAVVLHHPPTDRRMLSPYPPGVPVAESEQLGTALREANPSTIVLAGHRHRNRRRVIAGMDVNEVGSTKDYPGQWAGYAVHEGGIRQVVRRVADPMALAWTEATGEAVGGLWRRWAPGALDDRCWTRAW